MKITLAQANSIAAKVGLEIRKSTSGEKKDALYRGEDNPRWVIDAGEFIPKKSFPTVGEAFRRVSEMRYEDLCRAELTARQMNLVNTAVE